jgi:hypothetical protein
MTRLKSLLVAAIALVSFGAASQPAQAQVSLASLLTPGATITVDKFVFSNFINYSGFLNIGGVIMPINPATIIVSPVVDVAAPGFVGLRFQFVPALQVSGGDSGDVAFNYTITTNNGDPITAISSSIVGAVSPVPAPSSTRADLAETVIGTPDFLGVGINDPFFNVSGIKFLTTPSTSIQVAKNLALFSSPGFSVFVSDFNQGFFKGAVPEPSSLALISLGALGVIGYGWRLRRRSSRSRVSA